MFYYVISYVNSDIMPTCAAVLENLDMQHDLNLHQFQKVARVAIEKVSASTKEFKGPEQKMDVLSSHQLRRLIHHEFKCDRGEIEAVEFSLLDTVGETPDEHTKKEHDKVFEDLEAGTEDQGKKKELPKGLISSEEGSSSTPTTDKDVQEAAVGKKKNRMSKKERAKLKAENKAEDLDKEGLRAELSSRILKLHKTGVLALPPMAWDGTEEDEKKAVREIGSLFQAYKPVAWMFELYDMFRKLLMVAMLMFVYEGKPLQVGVALLITFVFIMYVQRTQPYSTLQLNNMCVFSFVGQFATLGVGLLMMANDGDPDIMPDAIDQVILVNSVLVINVGVIVLPFIDMEVLGSIPETIFYFILYCLATLLMLFGLRKRQEELETEESGETGEGAEGAQVVDAYNSDDELSGLHSADPYNAFHETLYRQELLLLFESIDKDHTGSIDAKELYEALKNSGRPHEEIDEIFKSIDTNHSNGISRDEVRRFQELDEEVIYSSQ
jgi:hypothetical protein